MIMRTHTLTSYVSILTSSALRALPQQTALRRTPTPYTEPDASGQADHRLSAQSQTDMSSETEQS